MATKVFMEALSPTMEEGRLVKWLTNEGDVVKNGDTLAEVETDKAIMELVARGDGVLRRRLIAEGATTAVGTAARPSRIRYRRVVVLDRDASARAATSPSAAPAYAPKHRPQTGKGCPMRENERSGR